VVDFINVPKWPTFNVADSAITVGVIMLGFYLLTRDLASSDVDEQDARPGQHPGAEVTSAEKRAQ